MSRGESAAVKRLIKSILGAPTHYEVLGVDEDASAEDIGREYRDLARTVHPDKGGNAAAFKKLANAKEVLCDQNARMAYDLELREAREPAPKKPAAKTKAKPAAKAPAAKAKKKAPAAKAKKKAPARRRALARKEPAPKKPAAKRAAPPADASPPEKAPPPPKRARRGAEPSRSADALQGPVHARDQGDGALPDHGDGAPAQGLQAFRDQARRELEAAREQARRDLENSLRGAFFEDDQGDDDDYFEDDEDDGDC
ncbi:hypothetical protein JL721_10193 [Aureococcus anophagefferens]|nr:hypothetical protein JL721_10193 [Aureococcus anophagefferens]